MLPATASRPLRVALLAAACGAASWLATSCGTASMRDPHAAQASPAAPTVAPPPGAPNFLVIVADDLGFSDLGSFGGEIHTPNLDRLAAEGRRYTNYYVSISCSPTRAMLLSGLDNHVVGLGNMIERTAPNQRQRPGYEGVLDASIPTVADALRQRGYHTYMAGKWHLGHDPQHIPAARGFERSFSLLNSAGSHFDETGYRVENEVSEFVEDTRYLDELPHDYYSSRTFTDRLLGYVEENEDDGRPFFAYLSFQAPHDPLQVPDDWLRRYKTLYDEGWDVMRERRLEQMIELGLMQEQARLAERLWFVPSWDKLTGIAQVTAARKMEIYAAMVEYLDDQVGRVLEYLEESGRAENTYVLFFSDNGPESNDVVAHAKERPASAGASFIAQNYRTDFASWGRRDSYVAYGVPWAQVSATPFFMFKGAMHEGGIRSPLIVWHPELAGAGEVDTESILHVSDVAPTLLSLAGANPANLYAGRPEHWQRGRSWVSLLAGDEAARDSFAERGVAMEMWGGRAYRQGPWKALWMHAPFGADAWQLFHVATDPGERRDLAARHPEVLAELVDAWDRYAVDNGVILPDRTEYDGLELNLPPRPPVESPDWPPGQEPNWTNGPDSSSR